MLGIPRKNKAKERDPEKEFRMAVGILMKAECEQCGAVITCRGPPVSTAIVYI